MPQPATLPLDRLGPVGAGPLSHAALATLLDEHERLAKPRLARLWRYYRNPMELAPAPAPGARSTHARAYRLAQEEGLPPRVTGSARTSAVDDRAAARREIVIENDIAWRLQAMVDFLFSKPVRLVSTAEDPVLRARIEAALDACWEAAGGAAFLQDLALLGHIYGHADLLVRALPTTPGSPHSPSGDPHAEHGATQALIDAARAVRIDLIPPTRGIAVLNPDDYRELDGYIVASQRSVLSDDAPHAVGATLRRALNALRGEVSAPDAAAATRRTVTLMEVFSRTARQLYEDRHDGHGPRLIDEAPNHTAPGEVPVAHIQNISQPFVYAGLSEVEPLIPLQDELNTRLSDRANRVTLQSFKMYLAKGLDGFDQIPVGPGQVWSTDNPDASVQAFGGDADSPSEQAHIDEIREALDKASTLPPLATGVVRAKVGNLTSENALRLTLGGVLTRTARKRLTYGRGLRRASALVLAALDRAGALRTQPHERGVNIEWPDPLPQSMLDALAVAREQRDLGVNPDQVLAQLGLGRTDRGVT